MENKIVYCHGLPGSPDELAAFDRAPPANVVALDRLAQRGATYEARVLAEFDALDRGDPLTVAGFSLGAMAAIHIAARRPSRVRKLVLISPAAPLELGDFLPAMAGRPVFEAAQRGGASLRLLATAQWIATWLAPSATMDLMFRTSSRSEKALCIMPRFRAAVFGALRRCTGPAFAAYQDELRAFVQRWQTVVDAVQCPVEIWHGDADTWAPLAMAQALRARLGDRASLKVCEGLGHYSTLAAALRKWG
jgi:pimeloyl-ACP methyl ester carboxylesterase